MNSVSQLQRKMPKRKLLLVLPLIAIPFLTMAFYALGGGNPDPAKKSTPVSEGVNTTLPTVKIKEESTMDKLSFYNKADKDSAKLEELMRTDPYYKKATERIDIKSFELEEITQDMASKYNQRLNLSPYKKNRPAPEDKLLDKLSLLQKELDKNSSSTTSQQMTTKSKHINQSSLNGEIDRLENMVSLMNKESEDPEIKQLNSTLDKILDVQHPERIKSRLQEKKSNQNSSVFFISTNDEADTTTLGFYSLNKENPTQQSNGIYAIVNENQVLVNGGIIKLRLISDVYIKEVKITAGNFVFGRVRLNGERLEIEISTIRIGSSVYPVEIEVFDMDGMAGIHIPGAITRDVAKQSVDNSLQMMELTSPDPSLKTQAAVAGVGTIKNLLSKKTKLVRVTVKAGYRILLRNKNRQQ